MIQCSGDFNVGNVIAITKFVECPVVDNTPRLSLVLYTGQMYVTFSFISAFLTGNNHI